MSITKAARGDLNMIQGASIILSRNLSDEEFAAQAERVASLAESFIKIPNIGENNLAEVEKAADFAEIQIANKLSERATTEEKTAKPFNARMKNLVLLCMQYYPKSYVQDNKHRKLFIDLAPHYATSTEESNTVDWDFTSRLVFAFGRISNISESLKSRRGAQYKY